METKLELLKEQCEAKYHVVVEGEEWAKNQQKALNALAQRVTVKGFRKGKAPLNVARKYINPSDVLERAADYSVQAAYKKLLEEENVNPQAQPELAVEDFKSDKLSFTFTAVIAPSVDLGEYKGLTVKKAAVRVTKAQVEEEMANIAKSHAELVVAEDDVASKAGDTVNIDFVGYINGEAFEGGDAKEFDLELGSNSFVPGFEEQLVGVKTNEDKDVTITFPEKYVAELAGKEATFKVHVNAVKSKVVPEVTEEFVKELEIEGVSTLEQFEAHTKEQLSARKKNQAEADQLDALLTQVIDNATFYCHPSMLAKDAENIINNFKAKLEQQGLDLEDYLQMTNKSMDDLKKEAYDEANKSDKRACVLNQVAIAENLKVEPADIEAKLAEMAKMYNVDVEMIKKSFNQQAIQNLGYQILEEKVTEFLKTNNNL